MKIITSITIIIVLSAVNAFAGTPVPRLATNIPTLSEWGIFGAVVVLGLVGVYFLIKRRKRSCCS
jgi:hypothetical protein